MTLSDGLQTRNGQLPTVNLDNSELHWLCHIQSQSFERDFRYLQGDRTGTAPIYVR